MHVENALQTQVNFVAMCQQFVEFLLAQHRAQRGLGKLRSLVDVIRNFHDRLVRLNHAQKNDGIHFQRDVVAGDDVLWRNFSASCRSDTRTIRSMGANTRITPGPFAAQQPSQAKDHAALVFGQNFDGTEKINEDDDNDDVPKPKPNDSTDASPSGAENAPTADCIAVQRGGAQIERRVVLGLMRECRSKFAS